MNYTIRKGADLLHPASWTRTVEGEALVLPEYPVLKLFIRNNTASLKEWHEITEAKTGELLAEEFSREDAIREAKKKIAKAGIEKVEKVIRQQVELFGGELNK